MEESNDNEDVHGDSPRKILSLEPTREPVHQSENFTKEPTLAPDSGTSPYSSATTREDKKGTYPQETS